MCYKISAYQIATLDREFTILNMGDHDKMYDIFLMRLSSVTIYRIENA